MQAFGNIASPIQRKTTKAGKDYSEFRLAESQRSKPGSTTEEPTWYTVRLLNGTVPEFVKGDFVKVTGKLKADFYMGREGKPSGTLLILAFEAGKIAKPAALKDGEKSRATVDSKETATEKVQATHTARTQELATGKPQVQAQERQGEAVALQQQESDWSSLYS